MDREQTFDVVDTPAHDSRDWPSIEDFQEPEKTLRWLDVPLGTYKLLKYTNMVKANTDRLLC